MRRYSIFGVVGLGLLLISIAGSSVSIAFPVLIEDFSTNLVIAGWVLTSFQLVNTVIMPLAGKISDTIGKKLTFLGCTLFFIVGSLICALSPNIYVLIVGRVVQAIGGGAFLPVCTGIVSDLFPEARQRYIGLISSIFPVGMIIGPNLGGWMVEKFSWHSIFWLNVPLGLLVLGLSAWLLQVDKNNNKAGKIDYLGSGYLFAAVAALMFALTYIGNSDNGINWPLTLLFIALCIVFFILFIRREKTTPEAIIDITLLKQKQFMAANAYNFIYGASALGVLSLIPVFLVNVYGFSVLQSGVLLSARSIGMIIMSTLTSFLMWKWGYRKPMLFGNLVITAHLIMLALHPAGNDSVWLLSAPVLMFGILGFGGLGMGCSVPAANNACIELMPDKVATITGLRGMFRNLGSTTGVAVGTVVLHKLGSDARAFAVVFIALAVIMIVTIPVIYGMPERG